MSKEKALRELGKFVQNCKCGLMLAEKDFRKGLATCPGCGEDQQLPVAANKSDVVEKIDKAE